MVQSKGKTSIDILEGNLNKNILLFAIPLAVTGILQQLFNAADVAVVGQFVGEKAMAAVGSNTSIVGLIVNLFVGLSLGCNVVIASLTGSGQTEDISKAVKLSLLLAVLSGVIAAVVGEIVAVPLLQLTSVPSDVFPMAEAYLRIYLIGLPVILLYNFESAIFRSQGDSVTPLIALVISGVLNVGLNLFFVLVCHMTADGVALATVIANTVSSGILFIKLLHSKLPISISNFQIKMDPLLLKKMLIIGLPAGIQSSLFSIANICVQSGVNSLGTEIMAASSAAFNVEIFVYYILNAFGQACTTFTGQNSGAGNYKRCHLIMQHCLGLGTAFTLVISGIILMVGEPVLHIFNSNPEVISSGLIRLKFILYAEILNLLIEIFSGALRGYGLSMGTALISLFAICGLRIFWVFCIFPMHKTFSMLLWCYPLSWALAAMAIAIYYVIKHPRAEQEPKQISA